MPICRGSCQAQPLAAGRKLQSGHRLRAVLQQGLAVEGCVLAALRGLLPDADAACRVRQRQQAAVHGVAPGDLRQHAIR